MTVELFHVTFLFTKVLFRLNNSSLLYDLRIYVAETMEESVKIKQEVRDTKTRRIIYRFSNF